MSRQTDVVSEAELREILGDADEGATLPSKIDTHSGYWLRDGIDTFRFVWTIAEEDR